MIISAKVTSDDLSSAIAERLEEIEGGVDKALGKIALNIKKEAQTTSDFHDKTGKLRSSIRKSKVEGGYKVGSKARHAHLVEFGHWLVAWGNPTGKQVGPRSFLRKASDKVAPSVDEILREVK